MRWRSRNTRRQMFVKITVEDPESFRSGTPKSKCVISHSLVPSGRKCKHPLEMHLLVDINFLKDLLDVNFLTRSWSLGRKRHGDLSIALYLPARLNNLNRSSITNLFLSLISVNITSFVYHYGMWSVRGERLLRNVTFDGDSESKHILNYLARW